MRYPNELPDREHSTKTTKEGGKMSKEIKKQLDFVEWLKSVGLYNPMESALTMRKLQAVYDELRGAE